MEAKVLTPKYCSIGGFGGDGYESSQFYFISIGGVCGLARVDTKVLKIQSIGCNGGLGAKDLTLKKSKYWRQVRKRKGCVKMNYVLAGMAGGHQSIRFSKHAAIAEKV